MQTESFPIQRERLVRYCEVLCFVAGLYFIGWVLLRIGFAKAIREWAKSLEYRLEGDYLSVYSCSRLWDFVLRSQEQRIPLMKITDVKLVQGPILNRLNLWSLYIQTASTGTGVPEAVLWGLESPREVRDEILAAIENARNS
ncbi:MAG: PH domain-containing protein [Pirellulales bacterium]|nr:PH domain-containing protein [Pirellulales bacterium]